MILYPPKKFDVDEILILSIVIITWMLMFKLPKHLNAVIVLLLWTLNFFLALLADITFAVPPYDLYFTNDTPEKFQIFDLIQYLLGYPPFAYFALNYYASNKSTGLKLALFIVVCAIITTGFEWVAVHCHVYTYTGWKIQYSFFVYVILYWLNIKLLQFVLKRLKPF